jgi:hypothetical protein
MRIRLAGILAALALCAAMPLLGHHSTALYDSTKVVTMKGVVTSVEFHNPHVRVHVDVTGTDGSVTNWSAETWGTGQMSLRGLTKDFLKPGDRVSLDVLLMRDGSPHAFVRTLTLPDGRVVDGPPVDR